MFRLNLIAIACLGLAGLTLAGCPQDQMGTATYTVTVENLSTTQPIAPIVAATHNAATTLFRAGEMASPGVETSAEDGDPSMLAMEAMDDLLVTDSHNVGQPLTRMGTTANNFTDTATFTLEGRPCDVLSLLGMLIATNDGFAGIDSTGLPMSGSKVLYAVSYDAGTEDNTEESMDLPDPASALGPEMLDGDPDDNENAAVDTTPHQPIMLHPGISGGADLDPEVHGWAEPVLRVTITRNNPTS